MVISKESAPLLEKMITHAPFIPNGRAGVFLTDENSVKQFHEQHDKITINNPEIEARKTKTRFEKTSHVHPDISNECLKAALEFFGIKNISDVRELEVSVDDEDYEVYSFRCQVYDDENTKTFHNNF